MNDYRQKLFAAQMLKKFPLGKEKRMIVNNIEIHWTCVGRWHNEMH
jgi:hypothetical protein